MNDIKNRNNNYHSCLQLDMAEKTFWGVHYHAKVLHFNDHKQQSNQVPLQVYTQKAIDKDNGKKTLDGENKNKTQKWSRQGRWQHYRKWWIGEHYLTNE